MGTVLGTFRMLNTRAGCVATSIVFLPHTTTLFTKHTASVPMAPKSQSKATTKPPADSRKRQASNTDQQPIKRSHRGTKTKNNNNNNNPKDTAAADVEDQAAKGRGKGGKKATRGRGKKCPTAARCVVDTECNNTLLKMRIFSILHTKPNNTI
jgi:hypothetical protein